MRFQCLELKRGLDIPLVNSASAASSSPSSPSPSPNENPRARGLDAAQKWRKNKNVRHMGVGSGLTSTNFDGALAEVECNWFVRDGKHGWRCYNVLDFYYKPS